MLEHIKPEYQVDLEEEIDEINNVDNNKPVKDILPAYGLHQHHPLPEHKKIGTDGVEVIDRMFVMDQREVKRHEHKMYRLDPSHGEQPENSDLRKVESFVIEQPGQADLHGQQHQRPEFCHVKKDPSKLIVLPGHLILIIENIWVKYRQKTGRQQEKTTGLKYVFLFPFRYS